MTPPRALLETWQPLTTVQLIGTEFGQHTSDLERLSSEVRTACHALTGPGRRSETYDRLLAGAEAAYRATRSLCGRVEALCDTGTRSLTALYYTAQALLDSVADAEDAGCLVADDWSVLPAVLAPDAAQTALADDWAEVIADGVRAVDRAEERGRVAIRAAGLAVAALAGEFDRLGLPPVTSTGASAEIVGAGPYLPFADRPEPEVPR